MANRDSSAAGRTNQHTVIFTELSEAIDAAKKIVTNLAASDWTGSVSIHGTDSAMLLRARK